MKLKSILCLVLLLFVVLVGCSEQEASYVSQEVKQEMKEDQVIVEANPKGKAEETDVKEEHSTESIEESSLTEDSEEVISDEQDEETPEKESGVVTKDEPEEGVDEAGVDEESRSGTTEDAIAAGCMNPIPYTELYDPVLYPMFESFYFGCSEEYVKSQLGEPDELIGMETQYALKYGNITYTLVLLEKELGVVGVQVEGEKASSYFTDLADVEKSKILQP